MSWDITNEIRLSSALFNLTWNNSRNGISTTPLGNLWLCFTIPTVKNFQFTVLTICSCVRSSSAILLQLEELYSYDKVHKQNSVSLSLELPAASDKVFVCLFACFDCIKSNLLPATVTAQTFNPVTQVQARQADFLVVLRFLEKCTHFYCFVILSAGNTRHEMVFPVSFFSQIKEGNKSHFTTNLPALWKEGKV